MNSVVLIGHLARDVELSYTANTQTAVARFSLAVARPKKNGEDQGADFINIIVFGRQGEACDRYLSKGRQVAVRGRLETGSYTNRDGQKVYTTNVVADPFNGVEFLGGGSGQGTAAKDNAVRERQQTHSDTVGETAFDAYDDLPDSFDTQDDDIPF